ncbi:unnamed protein product [Zymoseptoria tritici ST99CH_3D1]|nr:unnamed protein product [Zymoseptoria tritici ST99CH_3D1]
MSRIEPLRANAFKVILQRIDAIDEAARPSTLPNQLNLIEDLITRHDLKISKRSVVSTPSPSELRSLFLATIRSSTGQGSSPAEVFIHGSDAFPTDKLNQINYTKAQTSNGSPRPSNEVASTDTTKTAGGADLPDRETAASSSTGPEANEIGPSSGRSKLQPAESVSQKTAIALDTKAIDQSQQNVAPPRRPTPSDVTIAPGSSRLRAISPSLDVSDPSVKSTPAVAPATEVASTSEVISSSLQTKAPHKRQLEDPAPEQRLHKRPNNGKGRAVEAAVEPQPTTRTFKSYPWNAPLIRDSDQRIDNVHRHIQTAMYTLFTHYDIDIQTPMSILSANPSPALEALYELAIGLQGQGWTVGASQRFLAKDPLVVFLASVLAAGVHKEIFAKPVPWETPQQILEHNEWYTAEVSRCQAYASNDTRSSYEGHIFMAGANMIRRDEAPQDGKKSFHKEIIDPLASKLGLHLFAVLRELFQAHVNARAPTEDPELERVTWTRAQDLLTQSCREALMLRGLYETMPVEVDLTWVQPGSRFDIKTMKAVWGWRPGHPGVEEPFEVTMSMTPKVTSEPGQRWEMNGECWLQALVVIRPLNKVPPKEKGEGIPMEG